MRLLVVTQAVDENDPVLGFFHRWVEELARSAQLDVVCLREGAHALPPNVFVYSLGKERGVGRIGRTLRFYRYIWTLRRHYDAVFVHMNPEYVVLGGWLWRVWHKRVVLWYSHRNVDLKLRLAVRFADVVASSAASSFRLPTKKLKVLGHGIDTDFFVPASARAPGPWRLVSVGRLTPIKCLEVAVDALALLRKEGVDAELVLVGQAAVESDRAYEETLYRQIALQGVESHVRFAGAVPYPQMPAVYQAADVSINLAPTGGLDKAALESMACGLPTLVSNEGFKELLGSYQSRLLFQQDSAADLARKLKSLYDSHDAAVGAYLRGQVIAHAGLGALINKLLALYDPASN